MHCIACNQVFICRVDEACWCNNFPKTLHPSGSGCLCYNCLINKVANEINNSDQPITVEQRESIGKLGPPKKMIKDLDYYEEEIEDRQIIVFSKWYLLRRAYCCDNNCRNCPYPK